jgi:hypothetical protein
MDKNIRETNPAPIDEPRGDLGHRNKTWSPAEGEQGISNRPDDEVAGIPDGDEADDDVAFNGDDDDEQEGPEDEEKEEPDAQ